MSHARTQIRNALAATLASLVPGTVRAIHVARSPDRPLAQADLPALHVFDERETSERVTAGSGVYRQQRTLQLRCDVLAIDLDTSVSDVDAIAAAVEAVVAAAPTLGGKAVDCWYTEFEREQTSAGEQPVAIGSMTFLCQYLTLSTAPETL